MKSASFKKIPLKIQVKIPARMKAKKNLAQAISAIIWKIIWVAIIKNLKVQTANWKKILEVLVIIKESMINQNLN